MHWSTSKGYYLATRRLLATSKLREEFSKAKMVYKVKTSRLVHSIKDCSSSTPPVITLSTSGS